jgi:hypothetical protein
MHAHLYTWGAGHATAEGERIPVKVPWRCPLQLAGCEACVLSLGQCELACEVAKHMLTGPRSAVAIIAVAVLGDQSCERPGAVQEAGEPWCCVS